MRPVSSVFVPTSHSLPEALRIVVHLSNRDLEVARVLCRTPGTSLTGSPSEQPLVRLVQLCQLLDVPSRLVLAVEVGRLLAGGPK